MLGLIQKDGPLKMDERIHVFKLRDTDLASESRSNCNLDGFEVVSH